MILKITNDSISKIKDGVYRFGLGEYPQIQDWEWNERVVTFLEILKEE